MSSFSEVDLSNTLSVINGCIEYIQSSPSVLLNADLVRTVAYENGAYIANQEHIDLILKLVGMRYTVDADVFLIASSLIQACSTIVKSSEVERILNL